MSPAVFALPGVVMALLILAVVLVSFYGQHLARLRWDAYYRRAAVRAEQRRLAIEQLAIDRRMQLRRAAEDQRRRHALKYRDISNWGMEFNNLLHETRRGK